MHVESISARFSQQAAPARTRKQSGILRHFVFSVQKRASGKSAGSVATSRYLVTNRRRTSHLFGLQTQRSRLVNRSDGGSFVFTSHMPVYGQLPGLRQSVCELHRPLSFTTRFGKRREVFAATLAEASIPLKFTAWRLLGEYFPQARFWTTSRLPTKRRNQRIRAATCCARNIMTRTDGPHHWH